MFVRDNAYYTQSEFKTAFTALMHQIREIDADPFREDSNIQMGLCYIKIVKVHLAYSLSICVWNDDKINVNKNAYLFYESAVEKFQKAGQEVSLYLDLTILGVMHDTVKHIEDVKEKKTIANILVTLCQAIQQKPEYFLVKQDMEEDDLRRQLGQMTLTKLTSDKDFSADEKLILLDTKLRILSDIQKAAQQILNSNENEAAPRTHKRNREDEIKEKSAKRARLNAGINHSSQTVDLSFDENEAKTARIKLTF